MKFNTKSTEPTTFQTDVLVLFAGSAELKTDQFQEAMDIEKFEDVPGSSLLLPSYGKIPARRILVMGLGNPKELTIHEFQNIAAIVARKAKTVRADSIGVVLPHVFGIKKTVQAFVEGMELGAYAFLKHKSEETRKKDHEIQEVNIFVSKNDQNETEAGIVLGKIVASAVMFTRDLVNEPPSVTTPTYLAEVAKGIQGMDCTVLDRTEMKKLGMGGLLAIARGSQEEPKFISLSYNGGGTKTIALIGKGITFDTGGLSLKPPGHMETMKLDMAGAAAILGVFRVLGVLKPKIHVVGLISATENMLSDRSVKPGDVAVAMNGKSMEILNTDAEGRVVLADALSYAGKLVKPDVMIDLATLTGACMVALGEQIAGLFVNDTKLGDHLKLAAKESGELLWELPLAHEYKDALKSTVADIKNVSGKRYGEAINGALFLEEFVEKGTSWAHLDIAGPAFAEVDSPLESCGGTGYGVRLILQYLSALK